MGGAKLGNNVYGIILIFFFILSLDMLMMKGPITMGWCSRVTTSSMLVRNYKLTNVMLKIKMLKIMMLNVILQNNLHVLTSMTLPMTMNRHLYRMVQARHTDSSHKTAKEVVLVFCFSLVYFS